MTRPDLLSQAEHGRDSQVMLVCRSREFAEKVIAEVGVQTESLGRKEFAEAALGQSAAVVFDDEDAMVAFADIYAPEHLIINTEKPWTIADRVQAAGSVFVGAYTPESAGDYASGTNHTLPTVRAARYTGGVWVGTFLKVCSYQRYNRDAMHAIAPLVSRMAHGEGRRPSSRCGLLASQTAQRAGRQGNGLSWPRASALLQLG